MECTSLCNLSFLCRACLNSLTCLHYNTLTCQILVHPPPHLFKMSTVIFPVNSLLCLVYSTSWGPKWLHNSFHSTLRDKDSTRTDKKTTAMTKKTQHTTKTHKKICNQLVLPVSRSVPCVLLSGSAHSSSTCLYLSAAALSRAT